MAIDYKNRHRYPLRMTTDEAIEWAGGTQAALAAALGIKQPSVAKWGEYPPEGRQYQIELLSGGRLKAERAAVVPVAMGEGV